MYFTGRGLDGPRPFRIGLTYTANERKDLRGMGIKDGSSACPAGPDDRKPVVMFRLDQSTLNRKELTFNVI